MQVKVCPWQMKAGGPSWFPWCGRLSLSYPAEVAKEKGGSPEWPSGAREEGPVDPGGATGGCWPGAARAGASLQGPASSTQPPGLRLETTWALPMREPPTLRVASLTPFSSPEDIQASLGKLSLWKGVVVTQDR